MTDSNRSPGFKILPVNPTTLVMFFGLGDYVIAESAAAASCFWMEHFDAICYANEFAEVPAAEEISLRVIDGFYGMEVAEAGAGYVQQRLPRNWVGKFGAGYLASTKGD